MGHRCGRARTAPVTTAASCDIRAICHCHGVAGEGGEIGDQRLEAVHRQIVVGALGVDLVPGRFGADRLGNDGAAGRIRDGFVVVVEQDRLERLAHVPFEIVGEHAQQHVGAHAVATTMMDWSDLDIDGLEAAERTFGVRQAWDIDGAGADCRRGGTFDMIRKARAYSDNRSCSSIQCLSTSRLCSTNEPLQHLTLRSL